VNLEEVVSQLYALPPEEFTAARGEAVAAARKAGNKELAKQIGALRRPTVGAWLVNLLAHQRPDLVGDLLALGDALRTAQRNLRGDELRALSGQRRSMVSALARESRALAVAAGRGVRAALPLDEVENTLTAALADAEVAEEVRLGRLVKPVEYAGFGEQPRPQLRLVHGGASAPADAPPSRDREAPPSRDLGKSGRGNVPQISKIAEKRSRDSGRGDSGREDSGRGAGTGRGADAGRAGAGRGADGRRAGSAGRTAEREAAERAEQEAAEEAAEREAAERAAAERAATRQRTADQRRRQQSAHRELLAARTVLAEAEAQRTAAEKAVREARRRVEKALAAVEAATRD